MTIIPFILVIDFLFFSSNYIIFCWHVLTVLMIDWITLIGNFLTKNCLICACSTSDYLVFNLFVLLTTEEYSLRSSSSLYSCSLSKFLQNSHCQIVNHLYYDSFHRYHLRNILYVEMVKTFCVGFLFLESLENPLEIFFWD